MKKLIAAALTLVLLIACVFTLVACSETELVIWVGEESATYYASVMEQYVADYAEKNGKEFPTKSGQGRGRFYSRRGNFERRTGRPCHLHNSSRQPW